jgi:hypothetical protein
VVLKITVDRMTPRIKALRWLGTSVTIAYRWLGKSVTIAHRCLGTSVTIAYRCLGTSVTIACRWLGTSVTIAYRWLGKSVTIAYRWLGTSVTIAYRWLGTFVTIAYCWLGTSVTIAYRCLGTSVTIAYCLSTRNIPKQLNKRGLAFSKRHFLSFVRIYIGMYNTTAAGVLTTKNNEADGQTTARARSSVGATAPLTTSTHSERALMSQELCTAAQFRRIHISNFLIFY